MLGLLDPENDLLTGLNNHAQQHDIRPPDRLNQDDRWLAASSLQKCIRRGMYPEALQAAQILKSFSSTHLWNRLAVIALEDVGMANITLAAQVLWVSGKQQWRNKHRGDNFILSHLIHQLCNSKGCRVLDDALYASEFHPLYEHARMDYESMSEEELCRQFLSDGLDVIERSLICRYLCGRRYPSDVLHLSKGNAKKVIDLAHGVNAPPHILDILGLSRGQEYYTCLLPCLMHMEKSQTCHISSDINDTHRMVGNYPDFAYDKHTRLGKFAFRRFLQSCPEIQKFLIKNAPEANSSICIGWGDFIINGGLLNKRIVYDGSEGIRTLAEQSWLYSAGLPFELHRDFLELLIRHKDTLYDAKRSVAR